MQAHRLARKRILLARENMILNVKTNGKFTKAAGKMVSRK